MTPALLDQMVEFAAGEIAAGDQARIKAAVRRMADQWPDEKALFVSFALTTAAARLEDMFASPDRNAGPVVAYRVAALVAADVLAIEALGRAPALCRDLHHFWRRVDPWFLDV